MYSKSTKTILKSLWLNVISFQEVKLQYHTTPTYFKDLHFFLRIPKLIRT